MTSQPAPQSEAAPPWRVRPPQELRGQLPLLHHFRDEISAAFIALFAQDQLFLVQGLRSGEWGLPGGLVDAGDASLWECATREFYEETGSLAPLPQVRLLGWFITDIPLATGSIFRGAILVLQTKTSEIPFRENNEMRASAWVKWCELGELQFRWPNDEVIPLIFDFSQRVDVPPRVRPGPWSETRPALRAGGYKHVREGSENKVIDP
eukprot:TRINITY_DN18848_c0_g1_i1.p1 TRINITY_DN18848_c0_g1~~TRINITY_DN18848_c0_g1_i1.p1  ORF type:complete len:235 (-),score=48.21 TRINITY_DN18848_c0_g1_i1:255-878(-)